ncbi:hypothetical protein OS493_019487 [Desmophyllum pertusum]|uniref:Protein kinase domain-containing protein n=1 Tax=Desmophyllum pertusum TaxID=174260 RepID=A0A9X0D2S7_9CNID|nr:hypothetical protein OS493_019487 [Desmophyllum pertusum]
MARNKRKAVADREKIKGIRKNARRRWRNKKAIEKALQNVVDAAKPPNEEEDSPKVGELPGEPVEKPQSLPSDVTRVPTLKKIRSTEIVRSDKFLGYGTFGSCYLVHFRGYLVTVKEFKVRKNISLNKIKKEVRNEAAMIIHLGDHRCLPLLFGVVTRRERFRLVTQFHVEKNKSLTLSRAMWKAELSKQSWLLILKRIIDGLSHIHKRAILHNDLKTNNVVLEKRKGELELNPVIIDFGKARFISDPKSLMSLPVAKQCAYRKNYPHIAPEIVSGEGMQSILSDIFSFGKIALDVLDLLPTATAKSIKAARRACC